MLDGNARLTPAEMLRAVDSLFQPEKAWKILKTIADMHAPSQTVHYTRAMAIQQLLQEFGKGKYKFYPNYAKTGNALLSLDTLDNPTPKGQYVENCVKWPQEASEKAFYTQIGIPPPKVLFLAHADEISYLVGPRCDNGSWALIPYCDHRTKREYDAIALRYQLSVGRLEQVGVGSIKVHKSTPGKMRELILRILRRSDFGEEGIPHFFPTSGSVQQGDRLVYHHTLSREGDVVQGNIDNAAGVTACLLAALALCQVAPPVQVAFAFTDEEEGPPVFNSTFARGARRLVRRLNPPDLCGQYVENCVKWPQEASEKALYTQIGIPPLCVNVDGHDISQWCSIGEGAVFTEKTSLCKGGVVSPRLYAAFKELAKDMVAHGIRITENPGYVSRSDDVACVEMTPDVLLLGYAVKDPHFNQAVPSASLNDILNLSKAVFWAAIESEKLLGC